MSTRVSYLFVVIFLLVAAGLRLWQLHELPPGLSADEITAARIIETARQGRIEIFYGIDGVGHEGLYGVGVAATTTLTGAGVLGYRLPSVFAGLLLLALIYALGKRLFGTEAGFAALAMLAINMYPIVLSRSIGPDMLLPLLMTAMLLALARALPIYGIRPRSEPDTIPFAALGAVLGLSLYVHPASFLLILIAVLLIISMVAARQPLTRRTFSYLWFTVVVTIVLATPYLIASLQNPALAGAGRVVTIAPQPLEALTNAIGALIFVGDLHPEHNLPGRPMLDLITAIFVLLGLVAALRGWRQPRFMVIVIAVFVLVPLGLTASIAPEFTTFNVVLPVLALLFGLGVVTLYRSLPKTPPIARRIMLLGMIALVAFDLQWTLRDLFGQWPAAPAVQTAYNAHSGAIARYLDRTAPDIPTVVCTSYLNQPNDAAFVTQPQLLRLLMTQHDAGMQYADCGRALILPDGGSRFQVVLPRREGIGGMHPYLRTWLAHGLSTASTPDLVPVADGVVVVDVAAALADTVGAFTTTAPVSFAPESPGGAEVTALPTRFGGNLTFLGDVRTWEGEYRPGDFVTMPTFWRVDGALPPDVRLFAHVLSDPAAIAAQADGIDLLPRQLRPRDVFMQVIVVQLPPTIPEGEYRVSIGAYEAASGTRLSVYDGEQPRGSRLFTGTITIVR